MSAHNVVPFPAYRVPVARTRVAKARGVVMFPAAPRKKAAWWKRVMAGMPTVTFGDSACQCHRLRKKLEPAGEAGPVCFE